MCVCVCVWEIRAPGTPALVDKGTETMSQPEMGDQFFKVQHGSPRCFHGLTEKLFAHVLGADCNVIEDHWTGVWTLSL